MSADAQPWHSKSQFCEIEAVHHLQTHKELMSGSEQFTVSNLIKETISEIAPEAYGAKSQLIAHMSDDERSTFVETALEQSDVNIRKGVVCGLTARMEDLSEEEISEYINHVSRPYDDSDLLIEVFTYNIGNNIEVFAENQRSALVKRLGRLIYQSGEPRYADSFEFISENASFLNNADVLYTIKAARRVVNDYIDSDQPMGDGANASSIRSCAGYAARCAANWAREAAAKAMVYEEDAVVRDNQLDRPVDAHQDGKTDSTGSYDRRSRESTFER